MDLFFIKVVVIVRKKSKKSHLNKSFQGIKFRKEFIFIHNKRFDNSITITQ